MGVSEAERASKGPGEPQGFADPVSDPVAFAGTESGALLVTELVTLGSLVFARPGFLSQTLTGVLRMAREVSACSGVQHLLHTV